MKNHFGEFFIYIVGIVSYLWILITRWTHNLAAVTRPLESQELTVLADLWVKLELDTLHPRPPAHSRGTVTTHTEPNKSPREGVGSLYFRKYD